MDSNNRHTHTHPVHLSSLYVIIHPSSREIVGERAPDNSSFLSSSFDAHHQVSPYQNFSHVNPHVPITACYQPVLSQTDIDGGLLVKMGCLSLSLSLSFCVRSIMEEETLLRERLQAITVSIRLFFLENRAFILARESRFCIGMGNIVTLYIFLCCVW